MTASTPSGSTSWMSARSSLGRHAVVADDADRVEHALLVQHLLRRRRVEDRQRRAREVVGVAEPDDARDRELPGVPSRTGSGSAARRRGRASSPWRRRSPPRRGPGRPAPSRIVTVPLLTSFQFDPIVGGPKPPIALSVAGSTIWAVPCTSPAAERHAGHRLHERQHRRRDRFAVGRRPAAGPGLLGGEGRRRAHDHVGGPGRLAEQLVEGRVHRVGEHEGARDEPDARARPRAP